MLKDFIKKLAGRRANRLFLLAGILICTPALYHLLRTAMYVHESVVVTATVTDVRTQPFESTLQALQHGNLALGDTPSYQPIVRYTLPNGLVISRLMTDADDTDYTIGEQVQVITPELDPSQAHINKWKFIWGWECMQLGTGVVLMLLWLVLREHRQKAPAPAAKPKRKTSAKKKTTTSKASSDTPRKRAPRKKKQA